MANEKTVSEKLLPCPFLGDECIEPAIDGVGKRHGKHVRCSHTHWIPIAEWNMRHVPELNAEDVDAFNDILWRFLGTDGGEPLAFEEACKKVRAVMLRQGLAIVRVKP